MKNKILIVNIFMFFLILNSCKNSETKIVKITPPEYLKIVQNIKKRTIIHYWFSYCTPCIRDFPELTEICKENNIDLINISNDNSGGKMEKNLEKVMKQINVSECYIIDYNYLFPNGEKGFVLGEFAKQVGQIEYNNPYYILIDENGKKIIETSKLKLLKSKI